MQGMSGPLESATTRLAAAITLPVAESAGTSGSVVTVQMLVAAVIPANIREMGRQPFHQKKSIPELVGKVQA